jgi:hypothetical protein
LPIDDRTGLFDPRDHRGVLSRHVVGMKRRTESGANAGGRRHILNADRQSMKEPNLLSGHDRPFRALRRVYCRFGHDCADRVDLWIETLNRIEVRSQYLDWADGFGTNQFCQLCCRTLGQFSGHRIVSWIGIS